MLSTIAAAVLALSSLPFDAAHPETAGRDPALAAAGRVRYQVGYKESTRDAAWTIVAEATGLPASDGEVAIELADFGSWTDLADYYLTSLTTEPPSYADPARPDRFIIDVPMGWDGSLRAEYSLHAAMVGSKTQQSYALLPVHGRDYTYGCTENTLMSVVIAGKPLTVVRELTITPPPGWAVFSGWAGHTDGPQRFTMGEHDRNGLIAMGRFTARADLVVDGTTIQVRQFGEGPAAADKVAGWVAAIAPLMKKTTGADPGPLRVFLSDSCGGGMMTDRGLVVGVKKDWTASDLDAASTRHTVAHELYHVWLGGLLRPPQEMTWFLEGFTDYLSLWHAAKAGVVPPEWMVRRLVELDARAHGSSLGKVAFADPSISWRDGNGPNETMAYAGGHILAFALDVELRARGRAAGVQEVIAGLLKSGTRGCTGENLKAWFVDNDALDLWEEYIAGTQIPDTAALLQSVGCVPGFRPEQLAYLGIRAEAPDRAEPTRNQRITELDPEGPAVRAGAKIGDVITGWFPARSVPVEIGPGVSTNYTFGLTTFAPGEPGAFIGILRDGVEHKIEVAPRVIVGGRRAELIPGGGFEKFFERE